MPRTPVHNEPAKNPYITKSISKTLLTPCRAVGLSRKRKTPNSANNSLLGHIETSQLDTTPLSSNASSKETNSESKTKCEPEAPPEKRKTKVSKRLIADDEESLNNVLKKKCLSIAETTQPPEFINATQEKNSHKNKASSEKEVEDFTIVENKSKSKSKPTKKNKKSQLKDLDEKTDKIKLDNKIEDKAKAEETKIRDNTLEINSDDKPSSFPKTENDRKKRSPRRKSKVAIIIDSDEDDYYGLKNSLKNKDLNVNLKSDKKEKKYNMTEERKIKNKTQQFDSDDESLNLPKTRNMKSPRKNKRLAIIDSDEDEIDCEISKNDINKDQQKKQDTENNENKNNIASDKDFKETKGAKKNQDRKNDEITTLKDVTNEGHPSPRKSELTKNDQKTRKIKRCLSMKKSSGDFREYQEDQLLLRECSISLSPIESKLDLLENAPREIFTNELKQIEKQVKEKRKLVEELKQAEIYKKKHNVTELQELTSMWKKACISGLNDLLPQLQRLQLHGNIDMATVLKNLNVPQEIITLTPDGELI